MMLPSNALLVALQLLSSPSEGAPSESIASVGGEPISRSEIARAMLRHRWAFCADPPELGGHTAAALADRALAECARRAAEERMARELGLEADPPRSSLHDPLKAENRRRGLAVERGRPLPGPRRFTEQTLHARRSAWRRFALERRLRRTTIDRRVAQAVVRADRARLLDMADALLSPGPPPGARGGGARDPSPATTYYVDSASGDDDNPGTSPTTPWRSLNKVSSTSFAAGDSILFRSGSAWTGALELQGVGSADQPIVVDRYDSGPLPLLRGEGVPATVKLENVAGWELHHLEITNSLPGNTGDWLRGVHVHNYNYGVVEHIHLVDLVIHDVDGTLDTKHNGGIYLRAGGTQTPTRFDDILIEGCYLYDVDRTGISLDSGWESRTSEDQGEWFPSTNVRIRDNVIERSGQNGLIWRVSAAPVVEHNLFQECSQKGNGNAAFFFNCDDALFQHNESWGTVLTNPDDPDAGGLDADYRCKRTIVQYNWLHDNDKAGVVAVADGSGTGFNEDVVIRYNILQDNAREAIRVSGVPRRTTIYNNTIWNGSSMQDVILIRHKSWNGWPQDTHYYNNIICDSGSGSSYDFGSSLGTLFDSNLFFGAHPPGEPDDPNKITDDPLLIAPGQGGEGYETLTGYRLRTDSPAVDSGLLLDGHAELDLWSGTVPALDGVDRGAHELNPPVLTLTDLLAGEDARLEISGATPFGTLAAAYALAGGGPTFVPGYGDMLLTPPIHQLPIGPADASGFASYTAAVPAGTEGTSVWLHAFDEAALAWTNALADTIR